MSKATPTPKRGAARAKALANGDALRDWLHQQEQEAQAKPVEATPRSGRGVTRLMQNITPRTPEYLHRHTHAAGKDRRHKVDSNGARSVRGVRALRSPSVKPASFSGHRIVRDGATVLRVEPKEPRRPRHFITTPLAGPNTPYVTPEEEK